MSSGSAPSIHYEVYTMDSGSRWTLHARYGRNERDAAMADAKNVEKSLQIPARVVRESYYSETNQSEESVIYAGDSGLKARMAARASATPNYRGRGGGGARQTPGQTFKTQVAASAPSKASLGTAAKLAIVIAASLTVAGTVTGLVSAVMDPLTNQVDDLFQSLILFAVFMVSFIAVAYPLSTSLLKWRAFGLGGSKSKKAAPKAQGGSTAPDAAKSDDMPGDDMEASHEIELADLKDEDEALPPLEDEDEFAAPEPEFEQAAAEEQEFETAGEEQKAETGKVEAPKALFVRFVNALTGAVRKRRPTLDAYNMFGVDLVLAGAIDVLGQQAGMAVDDRRSLLKGAIEAMGVKAATAQAFADKYEEYLAEPRYMPMIVAGRSTMESFMAGQPDTLLDTIGPVFEQWNKPQAQAAAASSRIMTVMFTDMVGSTDLTQAHGDKAAQTLVRRHNTIVRAALAQYQGKEIKHTGDGIMASFSSAASGVEAAIVIQRAIAKSNAQNAQQQELHIRIGINAGEPIEEEEDLFGTTVQLAARVCAKCGTDAILCSNVVKELSSGRGLNFSSIGPQDLKGFKEQIVLYEVAWKE